MGEDILSVKQKSASGLLEPLQAFNIYKEQDSPIL